MKAWRTIFLMMAAIGFAAGCAHLPSGKQNAAGERVVIKKVKKNQFQLLVNNKPYIVRGVCYAPIPIGEDYSYPFMADPNAPWRVDGKLMQEMGINTIRLYHAGEDWPACRAMIEELYRSYGIRTILGHSLGFWDYPPANYADPAFIKEITPQVLQMVEFFKDTPGLLFYNLGNENNYSFDGRLNPWSNDEIDALSSFAAQRDARARVYYTFINDLTKQIKKIDPFHPVALGNGETVGLQEAAQYCPRVDLLGCIVYRGKTFGNFFKEVQRKFNKPVVLTEFGCDAFDAVKQKEDQNAQAKFLKSQWLDMERNFAGADGAGNCLGGAIFEWTDEWWKCSDCDRASWSVQDPTAGWGMGAYDFDAKVGKNMNEEWFGLVALSVEKENGINKRVPRKAYYVLQELWQNAPEPAARQSTEK